MNDTSGPALAKPRFGTTLRKIRQERAWTLKTLSAATGIPISTLSKVERGLLSLSFANIQKLAAGLDLNVSQLVTDGERALQRSILPNSGALRSITRIHQAKTFSTDTHHYEVHASDVQHKQMETMVVRVSCRDIDDYQNLSQHGHLGEEFIYVLEGEVRVYTELYEPVDLQKGESLYFNAEMWHATVSTGASEALILSVCSYDKRHRGIQTQQKESPWAPKLQNL